MAREADHEDVGRTEGQTQSGQTTAGLGEVPASPVRLIVLGWRWRLGCCGCGTLTLRYLPLDLGFGMIQEGALVASSRLAV